MPTKDEDVEIADNVIVEHLVEIVGRGCEIFSVAHQLDGGHQHAEAASDYEDAAGSVAVVS